MRKADREPNKEEMEEKEQGLDLLKTHYMHYEMLRKIKIDHT